MTFGQSANELNDAIGMVEQALGSLQLGVSAKVELDPADPSQGLLVFARKSDTWRLLWVHGSDADGWKETSLGSASCRRRVLAMKRLDALHDALLAAHEETALGVKEATVLALDFARRIGGR